MSAQPAPRTPEALRLLEEVFGFHSFRGRQEEVIEHVCQSGDALVLMPTGGGKSLCYQLPALLRSGVGIVVSPLIALMQDQVDALRQLGLRAAFINSTQTPEEARQVADQARNGELDLLYVAPERLLTPRFLAFLDNLQVALFAIDEAHCVSQWGHDFRPEYVQLSVLHERYPRIPRIALTATADGPTRREIILRLQLEQAGIFISGFDRPNICYRVVEKQKPRRQLLQFLNTHHRGDAGIVYCMSRKKTETTAEWLREAGWNALPYHAGMDSRQRQLHQQRFLREEGVVIVATVAFGMGIDKPNVRFVAHLDLPKSLEAYYQETGRAGRDGLPANAWLAYGLEDVVKVKKLLEQSEADEQHKRLEQHKLDALLGFCELTGCRRQTLLAYFDDHLPQACGNCDTCLTPPAVWDGTEAAQKALSCIYRTGQHFGANYIIDVLRGSQNARIFNNRHHQLSTYGIGNDLDFEQWRAVFRQLTAHGLVGVELEHNTLYLTEKARPVLRGETRIQLRQALKQETAAKPARGKTGATEGEFDETETLLWEALRAKRKDLAEAQNVAPFVIFPDTTLREMVERCPTTPEAFATLTGVGEVKLKRYAQGFIELIEEHLMLLELELPPSVRNSLSLYRQGSSIQQIAAARGIKESTVYGYLAQAIAAGALELSALKEIDAATAATVEQAWRALPEEQQTKLSPLSEALGGEIDYSVLRCVVAGVGRKSAA